MEYPQLYIFYLNVTFWPKTESDLVSIAEKAAKLLNAPFAAVMLSGSSFRIGFSFPGVPSPESFTINFIHELLKKKIGSLSGANSSSCLSQLSIDRNVLVLPGVSQDLGVGNLSFVRLSTRNGESDLGWLVFGTATALTVTEEILAVAAAQRLSELYTIEQLKNEIELRNHFLSIVSHELKTPLTSIYGILQLQERMMRLKTDVPIALAVPSGEVKEQKKSYLKILLRQVERLNELIDGLLDVSRIQNGRFIVEPTEVDVSILVKETIQGRLQIISNEAGVKLSVEAPEHLMAWVDPVRMEEVVTNLVMNAIRFSPEGGVVWIKLREDANGFRLRIRDQGASVSMADRDRLFQPFEKAPRTSRLGGLGLGLYISRQIALLHGGNASLIESVPGKGNVIEAYFPSQHSGAISS